MSVGVCCEWAIHHTDRLVLSSREALAVVNMVGSGRVVGPTALATPHMHDGIRCMDLPSRRGNIVVCRKCTRAMSTEAACFTGTPLGEDTEDPEDVADWRAVETTCPDNLSFSNWVYREPGGTVCASADLILMCMPPTKELWNHVPYDLPGERDEWLAACATANASDAAYTAVVYTRQRRATHATCIWCRQSGLIHTTMVPSCNHDMVICLECEKPMCGPCHGAHHHCSFTWSKTAEVASVKNTGDFFTTGSPPSPTTCVAYMGGAYPTAYAKRCMVLSQGTCRKYMLVEGTIIRIQACIRGYMLRSKRPILQTQTIPRLLDSMNSEIAALLGRITYATRDICIRILEQRGRIIDHMLV